MATHVGNKFSWVIKKSSLKSEECIVSVPVLIGDYKWRLRACPQGYDDYEHFSLFLEVADLESLPSGWRIYVKSRLTIEPPDMDTDPVEEEIYGWYDKRFSSWGFSSMIPLTKLEKGAGFVVNGELIIVAEVDVLEVIGTLDASEKSEESSLPLKKTKLKDDFAKKKKEKEQPALAKFKETEENILKLKEKLSELEALAEEQKAELLATGTTDYIILE